ncbi:MAG TPA: DUF1810 domain-containing protein [Solirubrobacteraceae bacterium]|nr:DUF1810 domain-containing protein [Solirubrobacteraceae bacterium]
MSGDGFDLQRFVDAQDRGGAYEHALSELRQGRKRGHWIWFVFPQLAGLGSSEMSRRYAIASLEQAGAYLAHPLLGPRLVECAEALLELPGRDPVAVLGEIDALKLRSSMTLFACVDRAPPLFARVLTRYYDRVTDEATEQRLGGPPGR